MNSLGAAFTIGVQHRGLPRPTAHDFRGSLCSPPSRAHKPAASATFAAATTMPPKVLFSFDVDGTLIHSIGANANKLHKEAFSAAFRDVFGLETHIDVVPHHGSTDPLILLKVLDHHGIPSADATAGLPAMQEAMVSHFNAHKESAATGLEVLPGVVELLNVLSERDDVAVCLVTGNLQPIGWAKMEALGIAHLFTEPKFGGFGSDFCSGNQDGMGWRDRAEFVRIAAKKCETLCGGTLEKRFHVGDAPMDVRAAAAAGATPIGVTTGIYTREQLEEACPGAAILDGLHDVDAVLKLAGLV